MSETEFDDSELGSNGSNAPAVETPAAAPAKEPAPAKTTDPTGLRDQIKASIAKVNADTEARAAGKPVADAKPLEKDPATGKFLPKDKQAAPDKDAAAKNLDKKPQEGAQPGADQAAKPDAAPGTWRADAKAVWKDLPPNVKSEILRREADFSRDNGKFQQQIQQINQAYTPIEQVIGPKRALWRAQFGSEGEALKQLVNLSDLASQDPNGFLNYYLSQPNVRSNVDLQRVFGQQAPGDDIQRHPVVSKLNETVSGLQQQVSSFISQQRTQETQSVQSQIEQFVSAKDQAGTPLRPHFDSVREEVFNLIPALRQSMPNATVEQVMDKAYNVAIRTNQTVASEIQRIDEQRIRESIEKEDRTKRAQLANKSIQSSGPGPHNGQPVSNNATDLRAELTKNFRAFARGDTPRV